MGQLILNSADSQVQYSAFFRQSESESVRGFLHPIVDQIE